MSDAGPPGTGICRERVVKHGERSHIIASEVRMQDDAVAEGRLEQRLHVVSIDVVAPFERGARL